MLKRVSTLLAGIIFWHIGICNTYTVCEKCKLSTIQSGIDNSSPGDTLIFDPGVYSTHGVEITMPLVLIGKPGAILDGGGIDYIVKILSDSVSVSGFELINSGRSYTKDYAAIYIHRSSGFVLSNNVISQSFYGILVEKSKNGKIHDNKVFGTATREDQSGNGIHLWDCDSVVISKNEVEGMRDGIYLEFVDGSQVNDNYSYNNVRYGLHFMFSNHDEYNNNTFENNGAGVAVMFSKFINMRENLFMENWGGASYGLLLKEIYDAEIEYNIFRENTVAINVDGSTRINYKRNEFLRNGWAVKVTGGCYENAFVENNFIANSFDVSYNSKINDNSFEGNYWSNYSGYDLNRDGTGDVPYRPVKLFTYIVNRTPETVVLLRSLFIDLLNFSEKVSPVFTPDNLSDPKPSISIIK